MRVLPIFATAKMLEITFAQMAELVDALVSNTSGATRAGSIPALGTFEKSKYQKPELLYVVRVFYLFIFLLFHGSRVTFGGSNLMILHFLFLSPSPFSVPQCSLISF